VIDARGAYSHAVVHVSVGNVNQNPNDESNLPEELEIRPAFPNPASQHATLKVLSPAVSHANIALYDVLGKEVRQLFLGRLNTGANSLRFGVSDLSSGRYFIRFKAEFVLKVIPLAVMHSSVSPGTCFSRISPCFR